MRTAPAIFPEKTEAEFKMYSVDFTPVLDSGVSIASVTWESLPSGLTIDTKTLASSKATARISSGVSGTNYQISLKAVTDETPTQTFEALVNIQIIDGADA